MGDTLKIAIVGAECTGKTTLARDLAQALGGRATGEVLRAWCDARGRTPLAHEQRAILLAQQRHEVDLLGVDVRWIVCDTTPLMTAIYSVHYFDDTSLLDEGVRHQRGYALTLLMQPDLAWQADGIQRDSPSVRARIHALLEDTLAAHALPFTPIGGHGAARLDAARAALEPLAHQLNVTDPRSVRGAAGKR